MSSGSKKILIVDDDTDFIESVSSFLEEHEYSVLKAYNGQDGFKLAQMEQPDLIIMDIMMTERTEGFFTIQEIRRTPGLNNVPILVLSSLWSAISDIHIPPGSEWLSHDRFLPKPVDLNELLSEIRREVEDDEGVAGHSPRGEGAS